MKVFDDCCSVQITEKHYGEHDSRPDLYGVLIPGKRGRLLGTLYTAAGDGLHPCVVLLHGIPGVERNLDLAQYLRCSGFHVLTFHYSGSWGSDGDYSLEHDLEDAEAALDFVLHDTEHGFDTSRIYAVGHSLGGFVCGQLTARRSEIKAGVLLMPCDIGRAAQLERENREAYHVITDVLEESAQWLHGTSGEALLREAKENEMQFSLASAAVSLAQKPLLCCTGSLDRYTPDQYFCAPLRKAVREAGGTQLAYVSYPTDHFFADYRLTVARNVADFLTSVDRRSA